MQTAVPVVLALDDITKQFPGRLANGPSPFGLRPPAVPAPLYRKADILILDEPTAVLTPQEANELFAILEQLKAEGMSIIFISHKLNEVLHIADRISVLRRGKLVDTVPCEGATEEGLARMMV